MFVGVLVAGFKGPWIARRLCLECDSLYNAARCVRCQVGICENHGFLLGQAGRDPDARVAGAVVCVLRERHR
eukprot:8651549-Lingulodinium_polyedra.AAC.1